MLGGGQRDPRHELRFPSGGDISSADFTFKSIHILSSQIHENTGSHTELISLCSLSLPKGL